MAIAIRGPSKPIQKRGPVTSIFNDKKSRKNPKGVVSIFDQPKKTVTGKEKGNKNVLISKNINKNKNGSSEKSTNYSEKFEDYFIPLCDKQMFNVMTGAEQQYYLANLPKYNTKKMTKIEAQQIVISLQSNLNLVMRLCYEMSAREGYKALGYESFKEFVVKELKNIINYDYAHKMKNAGEVHRVVCPEIPMGQISEGVLRPLHKFPDDIKKQIWQSAISHTMDSIEVSSADIKAAIRFHELEDPRENIKQLHKDFRKVCISSELKSRLIAIIKDLFSEFRRQTSVNPPPPMTKPYLDKSLIMLLNKLRKEIVDNYDEIYKD